MQDRFEAARVGSSIVIHIPLSAVKETATRAEYNVRDESALLDEIVKQINGSNAIETMVECELDQHRVEHANITDLYAMRDILSLGYVGVIVDHDGDVVGFIDPSDDLGEVMALHPDMHVMSELREHVNNEEYRRDVLANGGSHADLM